MTRQMKQIETSDGRYQVQMWGCTVQTLAWMTQPERPEGGYWDEQYYETAATEEEAAEWFDREIEALS